MFYISHQDFIFCYLLIILWHRVIAFQQVPFISREPEDVIVAQGAEIKLLCQVSGTPIPTVVWYKDGNRFNKIGTVLPDHTLLIQSAVRNSKRNDAGQYKCVATNSLGSDESRIATVRIEYLEEDFVLSPKNASISIGDNHVFKCIPPSGFPEPNVQWYKDNAPTGRNSNLEAKKVGNEYQLHISLSYGENAGLYTCIASNSARRVVALAQLKFKLTKPDVVIRNDNIKAYKGQTVEIRCESSKFPQPNRIWTKVGGQLPEANRIRKTSDGLFQILNAEISDSGNYQCFANNEIGEDSAIGRVNIYERPQFEIMPASKSIGIGRTVKFSCKIKGGKSPKLFWYHKGTLYRTVLQQGRIYINTDNELVIQNVQSYDQGSIECHAEDFATRMQSHSVGLTVLTINEDPPSITLTPVTTTVREGGSFTLSCKGTTSELLKFEWYLAATDTIISSATSGIKIQRAPDGGSSDLSLDHVILDDSTAYRCKATGVGGTATKVSTVTVIASDSDRPSQVPLIQVVDIKQTSVKLIWSEPLTSSLTPVTAYVITIRNGKTGKEKKITHLLVKETEKIISNLQPSTLYKFAVSAKNKNGEGPEKETHSIDTLKQKGGTGTVDRLLDVILKLKISGVTFNSITFTWNHVDSNRISSYILYYQKKDANFKSDEKSYSQRIVDKSMLQYTLDGIDASSEYSIYLRAVGAGHLSPPSEIKLVKTEKLVIIPAPIKVGMRKIDNNNLEVYWKPPENFHSIEGVEGFLVTCKFFATGRVYYTSFAPKQGTRSTLTGLKPYETYRVYVSIKTTKGTGKPSDSQNIKLQDMRVGEVRGVAIVPVTDGDDKKDDGGFISYVQQPWFIAIIGVLVWLLLLVVVVLLCCRRAKRMRRNGRYDRGPGLLSSGNPDYPNTSLRRRNSVSMYPYGGPGKKRQICSCCRRQSNDSFDEDFPNRADIKPMMTYTKHDGVEMLPKTNGDVKETNIGLAMKNGMIVDTPLNNELEYRQQENRLYDDERGKYRKPPSYVSTTMPSSGSMPRRDQRYQTNSAERRHAEIVRTAAPKTFPDAELVNVMENNPQAPWKQDVNKSATSPRLNKSATSPRLNKPPGENTLRRQGKTQFKPLPKLEVLNWADGLPNSSKASHNGSEPSSPKMSSSASMFSENAENRTESRMSHGGSSNSLNKYPYEKRRRRNSNASSMMSSELYQSEMDPSGYSDVLSDRKRKKEKVPPPIDLEGLTSDILLQWAESVTNSSPSSSGSSSPDRLSGISSEGSIYTDEDFAQAVAAVAECGGFNMDYDYSLPGMPGSQQPLSASRNSKMNKIDQMLAQRSKLRNSPASTQNKLRDTPTMSALPQISMSGYLTGSQKGPLSTHSAPSGIPRSKYKSSTPIDKHPLRYGTGFQDVDSVSSTSSKPLTMSNLMKHEHDSSLEREKKRGTKPLTISNLRQHETSLDRQRIRQQPAAPMERSNSGNQHEPTYSNTNLGTLMPETPLSSMSALERHESMNSNSKDSINSSNRHDSEVENTAGTSERKSKNKKHCVNLRDPLSSTSTVSTVRTSPDHGEDTDC